MIVRVVDLGDREEFLRLMEAYLEESGGDVIPCPKNLELYGSLFDQYRTTGAGVALVAEKDGACVGFTMGGAMGPGFVMTHGRASMGWGTYVVPEFRRLGVASLLRSRLDKELLDRGFDTIIGGYSPENEAAKASLSRSGFLVYQVLGAKRLK